MTRERAIEVLKAWDLNWSDDFTTNEFEQAFNMAISALSENKGEWTEWKSRDGRYKGIPICSNCKTAFPVFAKDYNFCPNCGADMRGGK